jgi:hypothetical protein
MEALDVIMLLAAEEELEETALETQDKIREPMEVGRGGLPLTDA